MMILKDLEKIYTTQNDVIHALKGITLECAQGEVFGVLGRAGAGKSTLLRCMLLLEPPSAGSVTFDHCTLTSLTQQELLLARRKIGCLFDTPNVLMSRTVYDNIVLPLEFKGLAKSEIATIVQPMLEFTELTDKADLYPDALSLALQHRVAIARVLVNKPTLLLCDDFTHGLDHKSVSALLHLLKSINETLNITLFLVTRDMDTLISLCHRAAILHQGEIVEEGTVSALLSHPGSEATRELIRASTRSDLPSALRRRIQPQPTEESHPILRITLEEQSTQQSLMTHILQQFGLTMNILQAHLQILREKALGVVILELIGPLSTIEKATGFLKQQGVHSEVIGYVPRTD